jgi:hypothetical protein
VIFSWTTILVGLLNLLVGGALVAFIRSRPSLRKIDSEREANLLSERAKEMQEMRKRIDKLEAAAQQKDALHEREIARYRHRINNLDAAFNALLLLLKQGVPVPEAVEAVEKMRVEQLKREALEAAAPLTAASKGAE